MIRTSGRFRNSCIDTEKILSRSIYCGGGNHRLRHGCNYTGHRGRVIFKIVAIYTVLQFSACGWGILRTCGQRYFNLIIMSTNHVF